MCDGQTKNKSHHLLMIAGVEHHAAVRRRNPELVLDGVNQELIDTDHDLGAYGDRADIECLNYIHMLCIELACKPADTHGVEA